VTRYDEPGIMERSCFRFTDIIPFYLSFDLLIETTSFAMTEHNFSSLIDVVRYPSFLLRV
jgi:hypothetical protein